MVSREQKQEAIMLIKPKLGERKSCRLLKVSRTGFRNRFKFFDKDIELKERIRELAYKYKRAGYRQIHDFIRKEARVNHKRIYRLYVELGLRYRINQRRKRLPLPTVPKLLPRAFGERWSVGLALFRKKIQNLEYNRRLWSFSDSDSTGVFNSFRESCKNF
ncbi:HTH-like domain protein [Leptospira noguchii str. 1993005606]|nr:HTH-like domain protein [Leptospira noguchii str. 1993005606]